MVYGQLYKINSVLSTAIARNFCHIMNFICLTSASFVCDNEKG